MIISTTHEIQGRTIKEYLGVVIANEVLGVNQFSEIIASFTDGWGGRSGEFRRNLDELYGYVRLDIERKARHIGANAIVGYSVSFNEVSGKNKQMFMATATGTAVIIDKDEVDANNAEQVMINSEYIKSALKRKEILKNISESTSDEDWAMLYAYPDINVVKHLIEAYNERRKHYEVLTNPPSLQPFAKKIAKYVKSLHSKEAINCLYDYLLVDNNTEPLLSIIEEGEFFEPVLVLNLLKGSEKEQKIGYQLLSCQKPEYSIQDIEYMKQIKDLLKREIKGSIVTKKSMFGTKNVFICPDGHESDTKRDINTCFCSRCGKNAYGYSTDEAPHVNAFMERMQIISESIDQ